MTYNKNKGGNIATWKARNEMLKEKIDELEREIEEKDNTIKKIKGETIMKIRVHRIGG